MDWNGLRKQTVLLLRIGLNKTFGSDWNESYKSLLSYRTVSNCWAYGWTLACVTIHMKATKAHFPIVVFKILISWLKSYMCDRSNESYGGLLSYTISNFWVRVWNLKCVIIQMKGELSYTFSNFCVRLWNPQCVTIQMKATQHYFPILFETFGSVY